MKLLNFSIGQIQTVQIGSEPVRTAHIKAPVPQPWLITENGALGDQRAVHPDKIYAYPRTGYDYWRAYLKVDPGQWPDGFFGENLTLDALDEQDVKVGDVFAIGEQVRLVVSGARTPCVKLAWRLNQPRTFQKIFAKSRRTGVYLGVLTPGEVKPGDKVRRVRHDPAMPSVADVCDFVADHKPPPLEPLRRLLAFEHLSPTIRLLLGAKVELAERAAAAVEGRWRGWRPFAVDQIIPETSDIRSVYLRPADGGRLCQPRPGQFVTVRMQGADGEPITRSWSLSAFSHDMERYRLTVRRQTGSGSGWLHGAEEGASVLLRAPAGDFALDMGSFRPVVLVAAGIGITPLLAMLQAHLTRRNPAPVHLIYGARTPDHVAFRGELNALAAATAQLQITYIYSQSDRGDRPAGRITPQHLIDLLSDLHVVLDGRRVDLPWYESDIYLCGPGDFCAKTKEYLIEHGANPDNVFTELFTSAGVGETDIETAEVRFSRSGVSSMWNAGEDLTLLELAERAGVEVESDCRAGSCLTCRTVVLGGAATSAIGDGSALLCIGRPISPVLILDC